ncbi:MAG: adenosylmethionine decarboxylase [Candidatus Nitrosothermus koennekii]|nr:MAG: adenosylmethionine decarboxylase [Candidatus Nitrosothermus koennekii]
MHIGTHLIIELYGCNEAILRDVEMIKEILVNSAKLGGATILSEYFHKFGYEGGVTGVVCIAESHISIHTWPEYEYAALDIFTCSPKMDPTFIQDKIVEAIKPKDIKVKKLNRGSVKTVRKARLDLEIAN